MLAQTSVGIILAIAIPIAIVLGLVVLGLTAARRPSKGAVGPNSNALQQDKDKRPSEQPGAPAAAESTTRVPQACELRPYDPAEAGISRRQMLTRMTVAGSGVGLVALGGASAAFLVPPPPKGFGGKIVVDTPADEIKAGIEEKREPFYASEAKSYIVTYEAADEKLAAETYPELSTSIQETGLMTLYQKCPHLGCRVPWCQSSQWFECPCHGSQFNKAGEYKAGPAPRGMDRFEFSLEENRIVIDTGKLVEGPPKGTDTTGQGLEGPHCV